MEDLEGRLRARQEECSNLKSLTEHVGWKRLMEIAEGQIENRLPSVYTRLNSLDEIPGSEFDKGEISGIKLFQRLPDNFVAELENEINEMEKELSYDEGERTTDADASDGDGASGDRGGRGESFEPAI